MRFLIAVQNYNQAKYLRCCLSAAIAVRKSALPLGHLVNIVMLDAGSTDESREICLSMGNIDLFQHDHLSQSQALNRLLESRAGQYDYANVVNGDDYLLPTFIEAHLRTLQAHPDADFLHGYCLMWNEASNSVYRPDADTWEAGFRAGVNRISHPTFCIPSRTFERYGLFDESIVYPYDMEFTCRLWARGATIVLTKEPVAFYRFHDSNGHIAHRDEVIAEHNEILRRYRH